MILLIRIFVPSPDPASAREVSEALAEALTEFSPNADGEPEPYWKIEGWYEHTFRLRPADREGFEAVLALVPTGWDPVDRGVECNAVWNPVGEDSFLLPGVRWAEVRLIHERASDS